MTVYTVNIVLRMNDMRVVAENEVEAGEMARDAVNEWMDSTYVPLDPDSVYVELDSVEEVEE